MTSIQCSHFLERQFVQHTVLCTCSWIHRSLPCYNCLFDIVQISWRWGPLYIRRVCWRICCLFFFTLCYRRVAARWVSLFRFFYDLSCKSWLAFNCSNVLFAWFAYGYSPFLTAHPKSIKITRPCFVHIILPLCTSACSHPLLNILEMSFWTRGKLSRLHACLQFFKD